MGNFHLPYPSFSSKHKIGFEDKLLFIGSCFSNNIGQFAENHGFNILSNPFGTIFHPEPIKACLQDAIRDSKEVCFIDTTAFVSDWNSAHSLQSFSKELHRELILQKRRTIRKTLSDKAWLFVTFGTSIGYLHNSTNKIVANCHKQQTELFKKIVSSPAEMFSEWSSFVRELLEWNSQLKIVFTISPVRHKRDGLIENNRSKARLFVLIEMLLDAFPVSYYPSFEIIHDSLRDYRFFNEDMVHPNGQSISEIWKHFLSTYTTKADQTLANKIFKLYTAKSHQNINENEVEMKKFDKWIKRQKKEIDLLFASRSKRP
tara:strand:+ start:3727 stop:4674 length:948 start_codon:yes stop_codon:yes gene_type:complete